MSKELKMPPKKLEPRTWAVPEEGQVAIIEAVARHRSDMERIVAAASRREKKLLVKFWRRVYRYVPEVRGIAAKVDVNRNGKAYIEEVVS